MRYLVLSMAWALTLVSAWVWVDQTSRQHKLLQHPDSIAAIHQRVLEELPHTIVREYNQATLLQAKDEIVERALNQGVQLDHQTYLYWLKNLYQPDYDLAVRSVMPHPWGYSILVLMTGLALLAFGRTLRPAART